MSDRMLRVVIVDDEPLARRGLCLRLGRHADIDIVAECGNGREALVAVGGHVPDRLFLDIRMPGMDGMEVVRQIQADAMPLVVFVTASHRAYPLIFATASKSAPALKLQGPADLLSKSVSVNPDRRRRRRPIEDRREWHAGRPPRRRGR